MTTSIADATPAAPDGVDAPRARGGFPVGALLTGLAGAIVVAATAPAWQHGPVDLWRFTSPWAEDLDGSFLSGVTFVVGVVLMTAAWLWLMASRRSRAGRERRRMAVVLVCLAAWSLPLFLGPPLLSTDVFSYAAQGELQSRGIDPTAHGPTYLLGGDYMVGADPYWRNDPAPYGPVWIGLSEGVVDVTGHDAAASIWGFRALALAGVAMAAVGVAVIARSYGRSAAGAIALGLANPLVLLHLVGGGHNDALMLGLLALGLAAVRRDRRVTAVVLVALATAVKLPAAVALPIIGWTWPGSREAGAAGAGGDEGVEGEGGEALPAPAWSLAATLRDRVVERALAAGATMAAGGALVAVLCALVGIGGGWVFALSGTNRVHTTFSATTQLGHVLGQLSEAANLPLSEDLVVNLFRAAGLAVALAIAVVVLLRSRQLGVVRSVAIVLLAVILLGPVVWPWYFPASLALFAAVGVGRYRGPYVVIVFATSLFVFPTSVDTVLFLLGYEHPLALGVVTVVTGAAVASYYLPWRLDALAGLRSPAMHAATEPPSRHELDNAGSSRRAPAGRR